MTKTTKTTRSTQYEAGFQRGLTVLSQRPTNITVSGWLADKANAPLPSDTADFKAGYQEVIDNAKT